MLKTAFVCTLCTTLTVNQPLRTFFFLIKGNIWISCVLGHKLFVHGYIYKIFLLLTSGCHSFSKNQNIPPHSLIRALKFSTSLFFIKSKKL